MAAPILAAAGALAAAAALGAASAGGAYAAHEAAATAKAKGPSIAAAAKKRFTAPAVNAVTVLTPVVAPVVDRVRRPFRRRVSSEALGYLERVAEACPTGPARAQCPCRKMNNFHGRAVEFLASVRNDRYDDLVRDPDDHTEALKWVFRPGSDHAQAGDFAMVGGKLRVAEKAVWLMMARKLYASGDLVALAVREAMQNSIDAVLKAKRQNPGLMPKVDFTYDAATQVLSVTDNGVGMDYREAPTGLYLSDGSPEVEIDPKCILGKFLTLGASGKDEDEEAGGGFGLAKAVILGATPTGRWQIRTLRHVVTSMPQLEVSDPARYRALTPEEQGLDYIVDDGGYVAGTQIVLYDIPEAHAYSPMLRTTAAAGDRVLMTLRLCDTPDVEVTYNGRGVAPFFPQRGGRPVENIYDWGDGVTVKIRRFDRSDGKQGSLWVRAASAKSNMLLQWSEAAAGAGMVWDIVVDLKTRHRPKSDQYPITGSRDRFVDSSPAYRAFRRLVEAQRMQAQSAATIDWEIVAPEDDEDSQDAMEAWADDADVKRAAEGAQEVMDAYYDDRDAAADVPKPRVPDEYKGDPDVPGEAPAAPEARRRMGSGRANLTDPTQLADAFHELVVRAAGGDAAGVWGLEDVEGELRTPGVLSPSGVQRAVGLLGDAADSLGIADGLAAKRLADAIVARMAKASWGNSEYNDEVRAEVKAEVKKRLNPFGRALIKISATAYNHPMVDENGRILRDRQDKVKYDRKRSKRFLRRYRRYLPTLMAWDMTVQLLHTVTDFSIALRTGFVLDDTARGLCTYERSKVWVLLNPESFEEILKVHKERPQAIAMYLHSVAVHEMAHAFNIRAHGDGHDAEWAKQREDLGFATAHLLDAIEVGVIKIFRLRDPNKRRGQIKRLRDRLADAEARLATTGDASEVRALRAQVELEREQAQANSRSASRYAIQAGTALEDLKAARSNLDRVLAAQAPLLDTLTGLRNAVLAYEFASFVESPLGREALAGIEIPGLGTGADAVMRLMQRDPMVAMDIIQQQVSPVSVASGRNEALNVALVASMG